MNFVKNFRFTVTKCNKALRDDCASDAEINEYIKDIQTDTWVMQQQMDYGDHLTEKPIFTVQKMYASDLLSNSRVTNLMLNLRLHTITLKDFRYVPQLGQTSYDGTFFQVGDRVKRYQHPDMEPGLLYNTMFYMQDEYMEHSREAYGTLDLLGDLGGVTEVIMIVFGFLIYPISEHSFTLKAAKKMFLARTTDETLFVSRPQDFEKINDAKEFFSKRTAAEIGKHRKIRVRTFDNFSLFMANFLGCLCPISKWPKIEKYRKIYDETTDRIETELNIVKIIKNLKDIKILMKASLLTPELKQQIRHNERYLIDLEDEEEANESTETVQSKDIE